MHKILFKLVCFWYLITYPFRKTHTATVCGHKTKRTGVIINKESEYTMKMPLMENGTPEHCLECIGKMEINCAWCSEPILIGDPITLHKSKDPSKMPGNAVRYDKDPDFFVGCLRWDCADTGGDRCGFWMPPGKVHRVPSPIEVAISSGNIVFVQDLSNPKNLGKLL